VCLLAACGGGGGGGSSADNGTVTNSVQGQGVRSTLSAKAVSRQGDNVALTFTVTNTGTTSLSLTSSQIVPDILVSDKDGARVWWSLGDTTTAAFRNPGALAPGASYDYVVTWDQSDSRGRNGVAVAPGAYLITATDGTNNVQVTITISGAPANSLTMVPEGNGVFVVQANNLSGVAGMELYIDYDSSQLSSPAVTSGAFISGASFAANTATPGAIRISLVGTTPFSGSGPVAAIAFQVSTRNQVTPVISSVSMIDSNGRPVR